jgi:hypothetical protein
MKRMKESKATRKRKGGGRSKRKIWGTVKKGKMKEEKKYRRRN